MDTVVQPMHQCFSCSSFFQGRRGLDQHVTNCRYIQTYVPWNFQQSWTNGPPLTSLRRGISHPEDSFPPTVVGQQAFLNYPKVSTTIFQRPSDQTVSSEETTVKSCLSTVDSASSEFPLVNSSHLQSVDFNPEIKESRLWLRGQIKGNDNLGINSTELLNPYSPSAVSSNTSQAVYPGKPSESKLSAKDSLNPTITVRLPSFNSPEGFLTSSLRPPRSVFVNAVNLHDSSGKIISLNAVPVNHSFNGYASPLNSFVKNLTITVAPPSQVNKNLNTSTTSRHSLKSLDSHISKFVSDIPSTLSLPESSNLTSSSPLDSCIKKPVESRNAVEKKPYCCNLCPATFTNWNILRRHKSRHAGQNHFLCHQCPREFSVHTQLDEHARTVHSTKATNNNTQTTERNSAEITLPGQGSNNTTRTDSVLLKPVKTGVRREPVAEKKDNLLAKDISCESLPTEEKSGPNKCKSDTIFNSNSVETVDKTNLTLQSVNEKASISEITTISINQPISQERTVLTTGSESTHRALIGQLQTNIITSVVRQCSIVTIKQHTSALSLTSSEIQSELFKVLPMSSTAVKSESPFNEHDQANDILMATEIKEYLMDTKDNTGPSSRTDNQGSVKHEMYNSHVSDTFELSRRYPKRKRSMFADVKDDNQKEKRSSGEPPMKLEKPEITMMPAIPSRIYNTRNAKTVEVKQEDASNSQILNIMDSQQEGEVMDEFPRTRMRTRSSVGTLVKEEFMTLEDALETKRRTRKSTLNIAFQGSQVKSSTASTRRRSTGSVLRKGAIMRYECQVCGHKCAWEAHLRRHQLVHSDEKPHICDRCGMAFKRIDGMLKHRRTRHGKVGRVLTSPVGGQN